MKCELERTRRLSMAKGKFSARDWQAWFSNKRYNKFIGEELVIGVDCAKAVFYGAVMTHDWKQFEVIYFERDDIGCFIEKLKDLPYERITIVTEPTGTYGDILVDRARNAGFNVIRIPGQQVHNVAAAFDNIPSLHDGKAAYLLARLYLSEQGKLWPKLSEETLNLRALADMDALSTKSIQPYFGWLESLTARHWPEITDYLSLPTITFLELITAYGSPQNVAKNADEARAMMQRVGGYFLSQEKIDNVIESAKNTLGIPCTDQEIAFFQFNAGTALDLTRRNQMLQKQLKAAATQSEQVQPLVEFCGSKTALNFVARLGSPKEYDSPRALEKAFGINLCERSTGKSRSDKQQEQRGLRISKRGNKQVRALLFFLAMRQISPTSKSYCPVATAWYNERLRRNGGNKMKALISLMRKLTNVLWWLARGATYEPEKLFDIEHLKRHGHLQNYVSLSA